MTIAETEVAIEIRDEIYGDRPGRTGRRDLDWLSVEIEDFDDVIEALEAVGPYNDFEPDTVATDLSIHQDRIKGVKVGRCGSPVIQVRTDEEGVPFIIQAMRAASAEIVRTLDEEDYVVRAYWG